MFREWLLAPGADGSSDELRKPRGGGALTASIQPLGAQLGRLVSIRCPGRDTLGHSGPVIASYSIITAPVHAPAARIMSDKRVLSE